MRAGERPPADPAVGRRARARSSSRSAPSPSRPTAGARSSRACARRGRARRAASRAGCRSRPASAAGPRRRAGRRGVRARLRVRLEHGGAASLTCRKSGSLRRGRSAAAIQARCRRCRRRRPCARNARGGSARAAGGDRPEASARTRRRARCEPRRDLAGAASGASSSIGTISGGSLTIRGSPSTSWVSFANARRLSFARALASALSKRGAASTLRAARPALEQRLDLEAGVPDVERRMPANSRIASPVRAHAAADRRRRSRRGEAAVATAPRRRWRRAA